MPRRHGAWARNKSLYRIWGNMIARCEQPKCTSYGYYGARGIAVVAEWHDPNAFIDWALANGYEPGMNLDRIDNDGNYGPHNCHWITHRANMLNQRRNRRLELMGMTRTVMEWSKILGIKHGTIYAWLSKYGEAEAKRRIYRRMAEEVTA